MLNRFAFVKSYKWRQFFFKHGIFVFSFLMIPFLIVYISLWAYNLKEADIRITAEGQDTINEIISKIEDNFLFFDNIYNSVLSDETINAYLTDEKMPVDDAAKSVLLITQFLNNYRFSNPHIDDIYLLKSANNYVITANQANITNNYIENFADRKCFESISQNMNFLSAREVRFINNRKQYVTIYYPLYARHSKDYMTGMLVLNIEEDIFIKQLSDILPDESDICIFYSNKLIASYDSANNGFIKETSAPSSRSYIKRYSGANVAAASVIKAHDISVCYNYKSPIFENNWFLNFRTLLIIFLIILALSILSAYIISDNFYKMAAEMIIETTDVMGLYKQDKKYSEKFDKLSRRLLINFEKKAVIEKSLHDRMNFLRDSQFAALQTQITPHFLFNTLNILNLLELKIIKKRSQIGHVVTLLSDILRYSMDTQNYLVSFKDELNYTLKYLDIQNIRYGDDIDIVCDISDNTMEFTVLKFMLQPILENAIHYAIANNQKGIVSLKTFIAQDILYIDISDTGGALTPEKQRELQHMLENGIIASDHTSGLLNTNKRLKIIFGDKYRCSIVSHDGNTSVKFSIPKI